MVDSLRALGGLHTLDDFASFAPEYVAPISVGYRGYRLWECPPNGQGIAPLLMAKTLRGTISRRGHTNFSRTLSYHGRGGPAGFRGP